METSAHISTKAVEEHEKEFEDNENQFSDESEYENDDSFDDIKEIQYTSDSDSASE